MVVEFAAQVIVLEELITIKNTRKMEKQQRINKRKTPAEIAYDACIYFTDDFTLYNAETGK